MAAYLEQELSQDDAAEKTELLNRYLKQIKVRKLRLVDFRPSKRTIETEDVDQIVTEFRQFLLDALTTGSDDELPVIELE
jgi:hypothetical protein